ncbi:MAG TPA: hypothetical protein VG297_24215 [Bryobacteraceae bacterium]|nr:hypothetical protein [Bryobacteraceae bacterium]
MPQSLLIAAGGLFMISWITAAGLLSAPRAALPLPARFLTGSIAVSLAIFATLTGMPVISSFGSSWPPAPLRLSSVPAEFPPSHCRR